MHQRALSHKLYKDVASSLKALKVHWLNEGEINLARQVEQEIKWVEEASSLLMKEASKTDEH